MQNALHNAVQARRALRLPRAARGGIHSGSTSHRALHYNALRFRITGSFAMPVILVGSIKGGVGKSTTALALASEMRSAGQSVHIIDTDEQRSLLRWYEDWKLKDRIVVEDGHKLSQKGLQAAVMKASEQHPFVIVDVKGAMNELIMYATLQADMLIIPQRASAADLERSVEFLDQMNFIESARGRPLPHRVLITQRSPAIMSRAEREVMDQTREEIGVFNSELSLGDAYRAMFLYRMTLEELDAHALSRTERARQNVQSLLREIVAIIKESQA
ncbi:ParA family protein [Sphingomonas sp. XXL09]|uniref:ParA family protein n=1 Tax=Sphingomonas sp. XXL09 TaxID=3457787 RepID=UPI00406BA8FC